MSMQKNYTNNQFFAYDKGAIESLFFLTKKYLIKNAMKKFRYWYNVSKGLQKIDL